MSGDASEFEVERAEVLEVLERAESKLLADLLVARAFVNQRAAAGDAGAIGIADQLDAAWSAFVASSRVAREFVAKWEAS